MNRYAAAGIAADAAKGRRVLLVAQTYTLARQALAELANHIDGHAFVSRSNGAEVIGWPNGGLITASGADHRRHRGMVVDVVYVEPGAGHDMDLMADVEPCVAGSPYAEIIRA